MTKFTGLSPRRKIRHAMQSLLATQSFFGMLALRMPFSASSKVKTIAGNGVDFTFNPEWVSEATHDEIKGSIAHIVFACALKHHLRRGERDYGKWNQASRIATKVLLEAQDLWVPEIGGWADFAADQLSDLPVEVIYDKLPDPEESEDGDPGGGGNSLEQTQGSPPPSDDQQQQDQSGQGDDQPSPDGEQQQSDDPSQDQGQGGGADDDQQQQQDQDGGGSDDDQQQPQQESPDTPGEVQDAPEDQQEDQDRAWDTASKQAMQVSKTMGWKPGDVEQMFEDQHEHAKDWETRLKEYFRAQAPTDYSWSRPNRRFIDSGLYLPSLHGEGMGPVVVAIDNSASVDEDVVNYNCQQMFSIARNVKPERIYVVLCDTKVQKSMDFDPNSPPDHIKTTGGGGTHFQPVFDWVEEQQINPDVLIYMTDMGATDLAGLTDPGYPCLWAVEDESQLDSIPFGEGLVVRTEYET